MTSTTLQKRSTAADDRRPRVAGDFDRIAWPIFGLAASLAAIYIFWSGRDVTYSADDLVQFILSPNFSFEQLIAPYNGHFYLVPRLIFKGGLEAFGASYVTFRLLTVGLIIVTAALVFEWLGRRVGKLVALAPTLVLLVLGSDYGHVVQGVFVLWLAISCGVGALLALERHDLRGDVLACALLCVGIATFSVALAFLVGAAIAIAIPADRWRRAWVVAIPLAIYAAWWLHAQGASGDPQGQATYSNLFLLPAWSYQSLSATLGALSGLDYDFTSGGTTAVAGPVLAIAAIAALAWRLTRPNVSRHVWITGATLLALWALGAVAASSVRVPTADRYLLPVLVAVLLVAGAAAMGQRLSRPVVIAIWIAAVVGAGANALMLRDGGDLLRSGAAVSLGSQLGAIQVAGPAADREFTLPQEEGNLLELAFTILNLQGESAVGDYLTAADRYGPVGYSTEKLHSLDEPTRVRVDSLLVGLEGIALTPGSGAGTQCQPLDFNSGEASFPLDPGDDVTIAARSGPVDVAVRRFADPTATALGSIDGGSSAQLALPVDASAEPWVVAVSGEAAALCKGP